MSVETKVSARELVGVRVALCGPARNDLLPLLRFSRGSQDSQELLVVSAADFLAEGLPGDETGYAKVGDLHLWPQTLTELQDWVLTELRRLQAAERPGPRSRLSALAESKLKEPTTRRLGWL